MLKKLNFEDFKKAIDTERTSVGISQAVGGFIVICYPDEKDDRRIYELASVDGSPVTQDTPSIVFPIEFLLMGQPKCACGEDHPPLLRSLGVNHAMLFPAYAELSDAEFKQFQREQKVVSDLQRDIERAVLDQHEEFDDDIDAIDSANLIAPNGFKLH